MTAYTDYQSLYDTAHTMKQTLEKRLLVDILLIGEMIEQNEIQITRKNNLVIFLQKQTFDQRNCWMYYISQKQFNWINLLKGFLQTIYWYI